MSETVRNDESSSKNIYGDPPLLIFRLPRKSDLTQNSKHWKDVQLPIDFLLLTVKDYEFLNCYCYFVDPFRSYFKGIGNVYFGGLDSYGDVKQKVALVNFQGYSKDRADVFFALREAVTQLRPKAIFSVGHCSGMSQESTRLGDVIISTQLTKYSLYQDNKKDGQEFRAFTTQIGRDMIHLIPFMDAGWRPPLRDPDARKVEIHIGEILSGPELVQTEWQRDKLVKSFPRAIAIETAAWDVVSLACKLKMEWVIVKGISGYADGTESKESWQAFGSATAASLAFHVLKDSVVFQDWPHYEAATDPIPDYIQARGPVALEAYRRALETGKTFDRRTKIVLIGQDRVGKTSLRRYLRGEAFVKGEASTSGIEMISPVKNAGRGPWTNPEPLEETSALDHKSAELVAQELRRSSEERPQRVQLFAGEVKKTRGEPTRGKGVTQECSNDDLASKEVIEKNVFQEVKSERKPEEIPEKVISLVDHGLKEKDTSDNEDIWPFVWDFAGQAVYHAIHPIFLSQEAIYVLVSDLSKELSAPAQCRMRPPNHDEIVVNSPYVEDTNLDHMMRWLDLVHSLGRSELQRKSADTNEVLPPVVLVGTHADGVRDPCKEMESVYETICSVAHPATLSNISKELFFIDNTNPNRDDDPQIVSLRAKLLNLARKMPHINKVIPMQWLCVEQKVDEMVKKGMHYIGKKRFAEDISGGICSSNGPDDVEELLHFLQARGRVIYQDLPKNLDGLVVLDPQWLIKILCEIITVSPPWKNDPIIQRDYQFLGKKGLLSQQLLNRAFDHLKLNDIGNSLIHIMESFDVICNSKNCKGEDYPFFVPCMLKSPKNTIGTNLGNGPLSVFLTFNTNYIPSGLFCRLVVHFWEWASQLCDSRTAPSLFSNAARFNVSEEYQLTLECHKTVIELKIWTLRGSNEMEEERICEELASHLERFRIRLGVTCQWLGSISMELYVKCQLCEPCPDKCSNGTSTCILHKVEGCSHFDCGHYIPLRSSGLSCEYTVDAVPNFPAEKLDPWVQALKSMKRKKRTGGSTEHLPRPKMKRCNEESSPSDASTTKKRETRLAVKQGVPSDEDLEWLSRELEDWEDLGHRLNIKKGTLTAIDKDYGKTRQKIFKMLRHWKARDGLDATYTVLHDALCHPLVCRRDLAEEFCCQKNSIDS